MKMGSIIRIGICAAWKFKKWRFNRNAQSLGIVQRTYFHGFASTSETNIQVPPGDARQKSKDEYDGDLAEFFIIAYQG